MPFILRLVISFISLSLSLSLSFLVSALIHAFTDSVECPTYSTRFLHTGWWGFSAPHECCTLFNAFSSVAQSRPTLCNPMNRSAPGFPVHHQLPEFTQSHVHWIGDLIQPSHPLSSPSSPAPNPSQHQSLFQWVSSPHQVAKILEFQLQHQSYQWTPRTDLL